MERFELSCLELSLLFEMRTLVVPFTYTAKQVVMPGISLIHHSCPIANSISWVSGALGN